jgi:predicted protein tyrosine phosphatase
MAEKDAPFLITVCGLEELSCHADRKVSHVLSILDPGYSEPEAFGAYGEHARLQLNFHDIIEDIPGQEPPQPEHVATILEFGSGILRDPALSRHLLVHCHMGISRSTAAMTLLLAQAQPGLTATEVLAQVLHIRPKAWPNLRILTLGEEQLDRRGEFTDAAAGVYRLQMEQRPELEALFRDGGREREVALGLRSRR